ncbi:MAG: dTDP-4-dehydrorhamnose reductase [Sedimentisphaerales bacterium]|nr:dTDP-4-dehydrorhamnose reductase [Sedimentisphaerales bacterium]
MGKETIAILGGRGMLGTDLAELSRRQGFGVNVFDLPEFDITNAEDLEKAVDSADAIVNCAAYTNVDGAESEADLAYAANAAAVGRLGELAGKADKWVLHVSTDFVFDGESESPYAEGDQANPINEYGRSKLAGERLLADSGCRCCIVRVQWTYGLAGKSFPAKLIQRAKSASEVKVVDDQVGSPTATTEVAGAICELLGKKPRGLYHFAAGGYVSRYDAAKFVFDTLGLNVKLSACKSSDFAGPARRPLNSRFDCSKIKTVLDKPIERWEVPLRAFLRKL